MGSGASSHRKRRKSLMRAGTCIRCRKAPARPGKTECAACNSRDRVTKRERVAAAREKQGGLCSICGKADSPLVGPRANYWVEEHDHRTGQVRGAAHNPCNTAIGLFGDDYERVQHAAHYLWGWTTAQRGSNAA